MNDRRVVRANEMTEVITNVFGEDNERLDEGGTRVFACFDIHSQGVFA